MREVASGLGRAHAPPRPHVQSENMLSIRLIFTFVCSLNKSLCLPPCHIYVIRFYGYIRIYH